MFGRRCAETTKEDYQPGQAQRELRPNAGEESIANLDRLRFSTGASPTAKIRLQMQQAM